MFRMTSLRAETQRTREITVKGLLILANVTRRGQADILRILRMPAHRMDRSRRVRRSAVS
jgi:hypothetical protein